MNKAAMSGRRDFLNNIAACRMTAASKLDFDELRQIWKQHDRHRCGGRFGSPIAGTSGHMQWSCNPFPATLHNDRTQKNVA
jgi:hypothetical protein